MIEIVFEKSAPIGSVSPVLALRFSPAYVMIPDITPWS